MGSQRREEFIFGYIDTPRHASSHPQITLTMSSSSQELAEIIAVYDQL